MADTAPNGRPLDHTGPVGHWRAAHRVHGWCADCPGIEPWQELMAWRLREDALHHAAEPEAPEGGTLPFIVDSTATPRPCPSCPTAEDSLLIFTLTATTASGMHPIGTFAYCPRCHGTPRTPTETAHG